MDCCPSSAVLLLFIFIITLARTHSKMLTSSADSGYLCLPNFREYFVFHIKISIVVIDLFYQNKEVPFYS